MPATVFVAPPRGGATAAACYRAGRIGFALAPLVLVHLALFAIPLIDFSWWYLLWVAVLTRFIGLGITAGLEYSVALISEDKLHFRYTTSSFAYRGGLKGRFLLGTGGSEMTVDAGYAANNFKVTPQSDDPNPPQRTIF